MRRPLEELTPLWEEQVSLEQLLQIRNELGPAKFAAMYQGEPVPEGGAIFLERFWHPYYVPFESPVAQKLLKEKRHATKPPYTAVVTHKGEVIPFVHVVATVDTAFEESDTADYAVFQLIAAGMDRQAYVIDVMRERIEAARLYQRFITWWRLWKPDITAIERKASGIQLVQDIQTKTAIPIVSMNPFTSKEARARAQTHVIEGAWHLPDAESEYAPEWVVPFVGEHGDFPMGANDDQVDTTVMAAEVLRPWISWWEVEDEDERSALVNSPLRPSAFGEKLPSGGFAGDDVAELGVSYVSGFGGGGGSFPR